MNQLFNNIPIWLKLISSLPWMRATVQLLWFSATNTCTVVVEVIILHRSLLFHKKTIASISSKNNPKTSWGRIEMKGSFCEHQSTWQILVGGVYVMVKKVYCCFYFELQLSPPEN
jgi:hypothetical protein